MSLWSPFLLPHLNVTVSCKIQMTQTGKAEYHLEMSFPGESPRPVADFKRASDFAEPEILVFVTAVFTLDFPILIFSFTMLDSHTKSYMDRLLQNNWQRFIESSALIDGNFLRIRKTFILDHFTILPAIELSCPH